MAENDRFLNQPGLLSTFMTTSNCHLQQGKTLPLILIIVAVASISLYWLLSPQDKATITSDPQSLNAIGWGDDERELKGKYTGRGTTIASLGFRVVGEITGCGWADDQALQRRGTVFANAATGIEGCTVSAADFQQAQKNGDTTCLDAIESAADKWQKNWSSSANQPYEFRDVGSDVHGLPDGRVDILDKVHTIERLAGWPVGDPVPGYEASPTVWAGDYNGWRPADYADSCPVEWVQCFDRKAPLYSDVPGLEALGAAEGQCIVEIAPDQKPNPDLYGGFDVMREVAPDVKFVIAAFRENREDSMSRSADWLIENQRRFNIVAARTSNIMLLETRLLSPGLQALCAGEAWCDQAGHVPYRESCAGNPYDGGKAYAHRSVVKLPDTYKPIAWQYERMRDAGIAAIKGASHEG